MALVGGSMDADNVAPIDPRSKRKCRQHRLQAGGHQLALQLTSGLKAASHKTESLARTKPEQLIGAAVLSGCLVAALYLFKAKKSTKNKQLPASSPQVSKCPLTHAGLNGIHESV